MSKKTISFKGNYWWGDAKNVTSILKKEFKDILGETRVNSILIYGCDFNDGREGHKIEIEVRDNKITIKKDLK